MTHVEFPADDVARAQRFYGGLFGWEFGEMPEFPNYFLFSFGAIKSSGGAIGVRGESVGSQVRLYVDVDSLDETLAKVSGLGGKVVQPKTEIPGQGWYAVIDDSEGNQLGLYENAPNSAM
jgi:predicted enzyme related to lactoylglutathione lyase